MKLPWIRLGSALGVLLLSGATAVAQPAGDEGRPVPPTTPPKTKSPPRKVPPPRVTAPRARRPAPKVVAERPVQRPTPAATPVMPLSPQPKKPTGPKRSGLALQLSLGTSAQVYASVQTTSAYPGVNGRFKLGYRMGAVTLGLGLEFVRAESKDSAGEERNAMVVLFRPTLDIVLYQPFPLSLYLTLGVHGGFLRTSGRGVVDDELPAVGFHSGLGVRYFLHPRFALGMEGGFQGVWLVDDDGDKTVDGTVLFYGALVLLAIL